MAKKSIGDWIDTLHALREEQRALEHQVEEVKAKRAQVEAKITARLEEQGLDKATGSKGTVFLQSSVVPNVDDWDRFYQFIHRTKYYHLLERRPSVTGCRELFETKGAIPGVLPVVKSRLNLRSNADGK